MIHDTEYRPTPWQENANRIDAAVAMLYRRTFAHLSRVLVPDGIGQGKQAVIRLLDQRDGVSQAAVADAGALDRGNVARIIASLERDGYVRRERDPDALHGNLVFLTDKGREAALRMHEAVDAWNERCFASLGEDEIAELADVLMRLACRADELGTNWQA